MTPGAQVAAGAVLAVVARTQRRRRSEQHFSETEERQALRRQVAKLAGKYGRDYFTETGARRASKTTDLWPEIGKLGYLGVNLPEEYGGGGGGIGDLAAVCEELGAAGCPLLMMVVCPAICGTVIARFGTEEQKQRWLPGSADGTRTMAFAITEPDAGSNSHKITTTARRDGDEWVLTGRKVYISGVDEADPCSSSARAEDAQDRQGSSRCCSSSRPTPRASSAQPIPMEIVSPEKQFKLFLDDVRLPADALVGDEDAGLLQLFAGLNPERIMAAAFSIGMARFALDKAVDVRQGARRLGGRRSAPTRRSPTRSRRRHIEIELARLMMQKAAALYDAGDDMGAGRGRQHGEVRRRRGRLRRRRPGRADPRRQRPHPGVRPGRPAGRDPRRPDRPGQPRDDPQLRRPCTPWGCPSPTEHQLTQSVSFAATDALLRRWTGRCWVHWATPEREAILAAARRRSFDRDEVVFHEGDPADSLHLVVSGQLAVRGATAEGGTAI